MLEYMKIINNSSSEIAVIFLYVGGLSGHTAQTILIFLVKMCMLNECSKNAQNNLSKMYEDPQNFKMGPGLSWPLF